MIGTVYKIEVNENDFYIGSTTQKLYERERQHNYRLIENIRKNKLYEECRKHNLENIICIHLEEKEIENELEIRLLEQEYIDKLNPSLNHTSAPSGLSKTEQTKIYREKNKEEIRERKKQDYNKNREHYIQYHKDYRETHKEELKEKQKKKYYNNKEEYSKRNKIYRDNNVEKLKEKQKLYRENNKGKISERQTEKIKCPICNKIVSRSNIAIHQKSKKCLNYSA